MITPQRIRELLELREFEGYLRAQPPGAVVGVAADEAATESSDWAHKNVGALYLARTLQVPQVCVDYSGVTVRGECDEVVLDESLSWLECLLRALDSAVAGQREGMAVTKEQVLALLPQLAGWSRPMAARGTPAATESSSGDAGGVGDGDEAQRVLLQGAVDTLAHVLINLNELGKDRREDDELLCSHSMSGYLYLARAIGVSLLPSPTDEYRLETLLTLIQEAQAQEAGEDLVNLEDFWEDVRRFEERARRTNRLLQYRVEGWTEDEQDGQPELGEETGDEDEDFYTGDPAAALRVYVSRTRSGMLGVRLYVMVLMPGSLEEVDEDCLIGEHVGA